MTFELKTQQEHSVDYCQCMINVLIWLSQLKQQNWSSDSCGWHLSLKPAMSRGHDGTHTCSVTAVSNLRPAELKPLIPGLMQKSCRNWGICCDNHLLFSFILGVTMIVSFFAIGWVLQNHQTSSIGPTGTSTQLFKAHFILIQRDQTFSQRGAPCLFTHPVQVYICVQGTVRWQRSVDILRISWHGNTWL